MKSTLPVGRTCNRCHVYKTREHFLVVDGRSLYFNCRECAAAYQRAKEAKANHAFPRSTQPKVCRKCEASKPALEFYSDRSVPDGLTSWCKACSREQKILRRQRETDTVRLRDRLKYYRARQRGYRYQQINPKPKAPTRTPVLTSKDLARRQFRSAIAAGKIVRPSSCERCGSTSHIHGHHPDYSKPLEVQWLCRKCHAAEHQLKPGHTRTGKPIAEVIAEIDRRLSRVQLLQSFPPEGT